MGLSRRRFLAHAGAAIPVLAQAAASSPVPIGLELYSVRGELAKDPVRTVRAVAKMGYQVVEFYAPYFDWTPEFARDMRKVLDDTGVRCHSTHNNAPSFTPDGLKKAAELNRILGSTFVVMASTGRITGLDGWRTLCDQLNGIVETLKPLGLRSGYHNHRIEFVPVDGNAGKRPMEVIAANTPREFMLQLDVGTCVEAGSDPVAWIRANPGRINSIHCKDWAAGEGKGYRVLFGEGESPWKGIFDAAESTGGVEYYLIEQEGSRFPEMETAERCLATWRKMRG
jgi:sugar phosphate isomerase/epimerase